MNQNNKYCVSWANNDFESLNDDLKTQFLVDFFFYLGVVEEHGIICGQGHTQTFVQEVFQWAFGVFQEQAIVAEWRHCNWYLS